MKFLLLFVYQCVRIARGDTVDIGNLIEVRRHELGYTLEEIASYVGVAKGTVGKWAKGNISNMGRDKIARLSEILQISPLAFIYDDKERIRFYSDPAAGHTSSNDYTPHETKVITAYRDQPTMQPAVDRLLGVQPEPTPFPAPLAVDAAAKGDGTSSHATVSQEDIDHARSLDTSDYDEN